MQVTFLHEFQPIFKPHYPSIPFKFIQEEHQLDRKVKLADGEGLGQRREGILRIGMRNRGQLPGSDDARL